MSGAVDLRGWNMRPPDGGGDWFDQRFTRARALLPLAGFDTNLRWDFQDTVTTELVDVVGVADANAVDQYSGGVVEVVAGDAVITPSQARLQATGSPSHVADLAALPWYTAALARYAGPLDGTSIGDTEADALGLWIDNDNRVMLGVLGNASGGSTTNFVGASNLGASIATSIGPAIDGEFALWHLFEAWFDGVDTLRFAMDGAQFATTIDVAAMPAGPARLGPIIQRSAIGTQAQMQWDKVCIVVKSPTVGGP